jgi:diphthamide biosynthesis methyltransferase
MLYLVGLGLADEKDITVKGLEIVKKAKRVYLEAYTAVLLVEKDVLVSWRHERDLVHAMLIVTAVGSILWPRSHHSRP